MRAILLVQEKGETAAGVAHALEERGYRVHRATGGRAAIAIARRETLYGVVLFQRRPDDERWRLLERMIELAAGAPALVVADDASVADAVEAMRRGASDFVAAPIGHEELAGRVASAIDAAGERFALATPPSQATAEMEALGIVGRSRAMIELFDLLKRVAPHQSTVLVVGESGTGKELVARALHALGPRSAGRFVAVNCATLSEQILESELFGHEKGAFTGAERTKQGVMEIADGGTLLLDEVNEMGLACQAKLLRALERRAFRRVGGTEKITVDLNVVAASNVDLDAWVAAGRFREDLYYRLKVVAIQVPPLRERREVIAPLVERFLADVARQTGQRPKRLAPEALAQLERYPWPGNVRELRNCMESLSLMVRGPVVGLADLPAAVRGSASTEIRLQVGMRMEDVEREVIRRNLEATPTIKEAARALGMGLRTLHDKIQRYGLRRSR